VSSPLAIAAVSAVLLDLLNDAMVNNDLSAVGSFKVSALPPDRIATGAQEPNQLNLFLYQLSANPGWRNEGLPSHDARGARISNPPLALDLHYLLTAYGTNDLNAEILLGYAMEQLHDLRVIPRGAIRRALAPTNPINVTLVPPDDQGRAAADLADQIEQIKITPHYPSADELSKLWTAMQSRYRSSVAYQVSVVLIQGRRPARSALPVLTQGAGDAGPSAHGNLLPPVPTLTTASVIDAQQRVRPAAQLGDALRLAGLNLTGDTVTAVFRHPHLETTIERATEPGTNGADVKVTLPVPGSADAADWCAGTFTVALRIVTGQRTTTTNEVPITVAPTITSALPLVVARAPDGSAVITVKTAPPVHPGQQAALLVGGDEYPMASPTVATDSVAITVADAQPTPQPVPLRVRVDGVDTLLVPDASATPPTFDPTQSVTIT
jgi:Pvc16 N-terminal domain